MSRRRNQVTIGDATLSVGRGSGESPPETDCCRGAGSVRSTAPSGHHTDTKGSCLGGHHCRIRNSWDLRSDIHNARALSNLLTAETLSSWCNVLKRTFSPAGDVLPVHASKRQSTTHHLSGSQRRQQFRFGLPQ